MTEDKTAVTPEQAAYEAWHAKLAEHHPAVREPHPWDLLSADVHAEWEAAAQAAMDAATEGALRACGFTLADVARFLEAEAAAQQPQPGPHHCTDVIECADCALRAAVLAEVEAAADTAADGEDPECEKHADAILALFAAPPEQSAPVLGGTVTVDGQTFPVATPPAAPGSEASDLRAVIDIIWRMCQRPGEVVGTTQGVVVNGERLAARIADLIKNSGMEPF